MAKGGQGLKESYKEYPCDLCGSVDAVEVPYARLYTNDQPIHICKKCGFVYVKFRRSAKDIAASWSSELYGKGYTARIPAVKARHTYVADFIDVSIGLKGKTLVDIGAGEGQFLQIVRDYYGAEPFGIEPSAKNCQDLIGMGFECFEGTIEDYELSKDRKKVDIVTIMWTLENCFSCRDMLSAAHAMLKEDGYIVVSTGSRLLVPFKKPLFEYLGDNPADTHCFRFSANTLKGILAVNYFETIYLNRYWDTDYLCIIAKKKPDGASIEWEGDNYLAVYDFFERWHCDSMLHLNFLKINERDFD
jgi:2-polyprenyl-3-methyl-5-hydroxy-6-metoxy-1,4-benzoquinol methylase